MQLSSHPTYVDGNFEPRRIDLRPFILYGDRIRVLPGGLTPGRPPSGLLRRELLPGRGQQGHLGPRPARAMMLSRVADALYWMGRYLERAENLTRLLLVTEEFSTEVLGLDEELARAEWDDLRAIFPGPESRERRPRAVLRGRRTCSAYSLDPRNPQLPPLLARKARENARAVREALTVEVFVALNETYRELGGLHRAQPLRPAHVPRARSRATQRGILSIGRRDRAHPDARPGLALPQARRVDRAGRSARRP